MEQKKIIELPSIRFGLKSKVMNKYFYLRMMDPKTKRQLHTQKTRDNLSLDRQLSPAYSNKIKTKSF